MSLTDQEEQRLLNLCLYEEQAYKQGFNFIAGIDEAGRGPLAGPVVAAACILPRGLLISNVNDSKKLTAKKREKLFEQLTNDPTIEYGVGIVESTEIDDLNIYQATIKAMWKAVYALKQIPDCLLVDGMPLVHETISALKIIKGDQLSLSIAAASIIAKETRDRLMNHYHQQWPEYGFAQHKGYGTAKHMQAIQQYGPVSIHRFTFEPIKSLYTKS